MVLTATAIYERLIDLSNDSSTSFILSDSTSESDVEKWYSNVGIDTLISQTDDNIHRETVVDDSIEVTNGYSLSDIIKSHNDDPEKFDAAYVIRTDRDIVQYHKPRVGGKEPMTKSEADTIREEHVNRLISRIVNNEILQSAKSEFGV